MPSAQALIDLLAQGISATGSSTPTYAVDEAVLRRHLEPETKALATAARQAGPHSPHVRIDTGRMTVGSNVIPAVVLIAADGVPRYADPQYALFSVPSGGSVTLAPQPGDAMIIIAIGGKGSAGANGGNAGVRGGADALCIALGGEGGRGLAGAIAPGFGGSPGPGGAGGQGGSATIESGDGSDLFAFGGNGGQGGTGGRGRGLAIQMSTSAVTPNPTNSPILSVPSDGGAGGTGGTGGYSQCVGGDASYALAAAGNGGAPGDGGPGGEGGVAYSGMPAEMTFGNGGQGRGGVGGGGGDTFAVTGPNGNAREQPGGGGQPGPTSGSGARPGPSGSQL